MQTGVSRKVPIVIGSEGTARKVRGGIFNACVAVWPCALGKLKAYAFLGGGYAGPKPWPVGTLRGLKLGNRSYAESKLEQRDYLSSL